MMSDKQEINNFPDLWCYLAEVDRPIILYGMGDGADKVIRFLTGYGKTPSDIFASDEYVRGQEFHGMTVKKYSEIRDKYEDPIILVAFASSLPDICERVFKIAEECETYIPDVPVYGDTLFNAEFKNQYQTEIEQVRSLLSEERSRLLFDDMIRYKLYGLPDLLRNDTVSFAEMLNCFDRSKWKNAIDLGAYTGDTAEIIGKNASLDMLFALEPDPHSFKRLSDTCDRLSEINNTKYIPVNAAAWDHETTVPFKKGGSRSSKINGNGKIVEIPAVSGDSFGIDFDFIKMDVEGAEKEAISGLKGVISRHSPDLCISVYHRSEDIFRICLTIDKMNSGYQFYLRRQPGFPAWDLCLIAEKA